MTLELHTPGKINLFLDVLAERADGYHEIATVFAPLLPPADLVRVTVLDRPGLALDCDHPDLPRDSRNLCWRAAEAFAAATQQPPHWALPLAKAIPVTAGLGGGSSDAAAVLRLLNQAEPNPLPPDRLAGLAAALGADVPFFLDPRPALATGKGELLRPIDCRLPLPLVLINPAFPITAAWAYAHCNRVRRDPAPPLDRLLAALAAGDLRELAAHTYNALEFAVRRKFPLVEMLLEFMQAEGCLAAHVSGSGPTVYGLCAESDQERIVAAARARFGPPFWYCASTVAVSTADR